MIFLPVLFAKGKKSLLETAQLATVDLDAVGVAVFCDLALVNLKFTCYSEGLGAGDPLFDARTLECLCNLV
jgi:hypothetical protein